MTHEPASSPESHEADPSSRPKLFNFENFTPAEIEQLIIAFRTTSDKEHEEFRHDKANYNPHSFDHDVFDRLNSALLDDLIELPEHDIERANEVFGRLANSQHIGPRCEAAEYIDRLAEHQVDDPDIRRWTLDIWQKMLHDDDMNVWEAAQDAAERAIESGRLPLGERRFLYNALGDRVNIDIDEPE